MLGEGGGALEGQVVGGGGGLEVVKEGISKGGELEGGVVVGAEGD